MRKFLSLPIDWLVLAIPIILSIIGVVTIYTITFSEHHAKLALDQLIYASLGIVIMLVLMFTDYRILRHGAFLIYLIGVLLLVLLVPPLASKLPFIIKIFGASRWIDLKIFQLQPSEIFKLVITITGARLLANWFEVIDIKRMLLYGVVAAIPILLITLQPDLGTASIIFVMAAAMFLAARPSRRAILLAFIALVIIIPLGWSNLKDYQKNRIETFLNPMSDPQGQGYNVRQSLIAVGSGGLSGRGFGLGSQTVLNFLPVPHADFIFAGFAEATGFLGSIALVVMYILLVWRIIEISRESQDYFAQLFAIAIAVKILSQVTIHIAMNTGLLPVTGIPLPFMSYGGTAMIIDFASIGILESIYIRNTKITFSKE